MACKATHIGLLPGVPERGVWGVWVMVGVQGRVAFGLRHFCILSFLKRKFRPANSHEDPNLTMHWHRQMGNVAGYLVLLSYWALSGCAEWSSSSSWNSLFTPLLPSLPLPDGAVGGWVMVGVQGKVAFWIKVFLYILFLKKESLGQQIPIEIPTRPCICTDK